MITQRFRRRQDAEEVTTRAPNNVQTYFSRRYKWFTIFRC